MQFVLREFFSVSDTHYLNQVNGEDVQGLSHARVIGMLRKITGTVELEIRRYAPLHKKIFFGFGEHALQTLNEIKLLNYVAAYSVEQGRKTFSKQQVINNFYRIRGQYLPL